MHWKSSHKVCQQYRHKSSHDLMHFKTLFSSKHELCIRQNTFIYNILQHAKNVCVLSIICCNWHVVYQAYPLRNWLSPWKFITPLWITFTGNINMITSIGWLAVWAFNMWGLYSREFQVYTKSAVLNLSQEGLDCITDRTC